MKAHARVFLLVAAGFSLAAPARAADAPAAVAVGADAGLGVLGTDFYANVAGFLAYDAQPLRFGAQLPLKFMLTGTDGVGLRRQDWDEPGDFTRILRFLDWKPNSQWHLRLGEPVAVTLGNGAIVDHFYNATDLDHYKTSLRLAWHNDQWGAEIFANDVVRWEILAARAHFRPLGGTTSRERDLEIGLTLATDRLVPVTPAGPIDAVDQPTALRNRLFLYDFDVNVPLWRGMQRQLSLTLDLVGLHHLSTYFGETLELTGGAHAGLKLQIPIAASELTVRLETTYAGHGYTPGYLDDVYEVERFQLQSAHNDSRLGKLAWLQAQTGSPLGVRARLEWRDEKSVPVTVLAGWQGREGTSLHLWLATREMAGVTLRAHWGQQHVQVADDLPVISKTSALLEVRYRLAPALSVSLQSGTRWQAKDDGYAARLEVLGMARLEWRR